MTQNNLKLHSEIHIYIGINTQIKFNNYLVLECQTGKADWRSVG